MLVIRYLRTGRKNQPFFKIVVTDKRNAPRGGRFVEILGFYDPLTKKKNLRKERIQYWLSKGAKPSVSAHNLLVGEKIIEAKKIATHAKKKSKEGSAPAPIAASAVPPKPTPAATETPAPTTTEKASAPTPAVETPVSNEKPADTPKT